MGLESALLISSEGLANVAGDLSVISHNVANAATPSYADEVSTQRALDGAGVGMGVQTGVVIRTVNQSIQSDLFSQNATVSDLEITQSSLAPIDATLGQVGSGNDIASLLGTLQDGFSTLSEDPSNVADQSQVVSDAQVLAGSINTLSQTYTTARQAAENDLVAAVGTLNLALQSIGTLSEAIIAARNSNESVADLENDRDAEISTVSNLLSINVITQSNGDVLIETPDGLTLPTHNDGDAFATTDSVLSAGDGSTPGVTLNGTDVTSQLLGGRIGADINLRDNILPTYQAELDEFAQTLTTRFSNQGLTLFTNPNGLVPSAVNTGSVAQAEYLGYAAQITVNPAVVADPSAVRDGNNTISGGYDAATGGTTNAADFTPNPSTGPAGFNTLIANILNFTFGADVSSVNSVNTPWPSINTTGLGAKGNLSSPYSSTSSLSDLASSMIGAQAQVIANSQSRLTNEKSLQSTLQTQISSQSGVSIDNEMSNMLALENSYGANAKIIAAVQSLFAEVLAMVQ
jgi:flagellar hook-associated protein 1 FlgK